MKRCGVCRGAIRGKASMVYTSHEPGKLLRVRACRGCAARAVAIVPSGSAPSTCACGSVATLCGPCARTLANPQTRAIASVLKRRAEVYAKAGDDARAEAYEAAAASVLAVDRAVRE